MGKNQSKPSLEDKILDVKIMSKEQQRASAKCRKDQKTEEVKAMRALERGDVECQRIHAENAVRKENESKRHLKLSAKMDAIASMIQEAQSTNKMTQDLKEMVDFMDGAVKKSSQNESTMTFDNLEQLFVNMERRARTAEHVLPDGNVPEDQVLEKMRSIEQAYTTRVASMLPSIDGEPLSACLSPSALPNPKVVIPVGADPWATSSRGRGEAPHQTPAAAPRPTTPQQQPHPPPQYDSSSPHLDSRLANLQAQVDGLYD